VFKDSFFKLEHATVVMDAQDSETCPSFLPAIDSTPAAVFLLQSNVPDRWAQRNEPSHEFGITG
jgi:hypothetical protein